MTARCSLLSRALAAALFVSALPAGAQERAASGGGVDLVNQLTELRAELRDLRADVERLQQQSGQAQAIARSQYLDLDDRLEQLERAGQGEGKVDAAAPSAQEPGQSAKDPPAKPEPPAPTSRADAADVAEVAGTATTAADAADAADAAEVADAEAGPQDERAAYDLAFAALRAGNYPQSAHLFEDFLRAFPDGGFAPNARYWLGESYYVVEDYTSAEAQFKRLVERWPDSDKAPGALLKVGLAQFGQKRYDAAEATLAEVERRWPGTDTAKTAADRLRAIQLSRLN